MNVIITGGAGFIGSNFVVYFMEQHPECTVVNIDKLTYAGDLENLEGVQDHPKHIFVEADIADKTKMEEVFGEYKPHSVIHIAAETHVDRSIEDSSPFVHSNVLGTQVLLDCARKHGVEKFVHVSTDEVYGSIAEGLFTEESPLAPNSPYAASKAASDLLVRSYCVTHKFPAVITRCSNNYGPKQYPEKIVPFFVKRALEGKTLPVYGTGENVRDWLHVLDHCRAIDLVWQKGQIGEVYNIGTHNEKQNIEVTKKILEILELPDDRIEFVEDRPGHDLRYGIDSSKIQQELGWKAEVDFDSGFRETVEWFQKKLTR